MTFVETHQSHQLPSVELDAAYIMCAHCHVTHKWFKGVSLPAPHLTSRRHFMNQSDNIRQASYSAYKTLNQNVSSLSFTEAVLLAAYACYVGLVRWRAGFTPAKQCCNTDLLHLPKCFPIFVSFDHNQLLRSRN